MALLIAWLMVACATTPTFKASLSGAKEVPAVVTTATGSATVTLEGKTIKLTGSYSGLSGAATAAHIHGPASKTETAGVILGLTATEGATAGSGTLAGTGTLTDAQIADLKAGRYYVNVHTAQNPPGEIRGQLE